MTFPTTRLRRLRMKPALRTLVRETHVTPDDLVAPIFVVPGTKVRQEISSLPGQYHLSADMCAAQAAQLREVGVQACLLFGIPESKNEIGSAASAPDGTVQRASETIKTAVPDLLVVSDLCFCEYTSHGHCGVMADGELDNDATLPHLVKQALSHADAGVDIIAQSGMLDGAVGTLRRALDQHGRSDMPIMSYAAKFASGFYGPFREAVQSAPEYGDRRSYQMDPANFDEALREVALDIEEGADIVMVKPALAFLDVIYAVKERFQMPTAAYNVSGEYAMVKAAAQRGWIDERRVMVEMLTCIKRAGADIIISYFAEEFATLFRRGETSR